MHFSQKCLTLILLFVIMVLSKKKRGFKMKVIILQLVDKCVPLCVIKENEFSLEKVKDVLLEKHIINLNEHENSEFTIDTSSDDLGWHTVWMENSNGDIEGVRATFSEIK